jgi:uncharacterized membrane-anchored protein
MERSGEVMNPKLSFMLFVAMSIVQLATPLGQIWKYEDVLQNGRQYKFLTAPVDPYDAFRGKYVALNYANTWTILREGHNLGPRGSAYVTLHTHENGFAQFGNLTVKPPTSGDYVRVEYWLTGMNNATFRMPFNRFYMEESKAPQAERAYWNNPNRRGQASGQSYVLVRVKDGRGVIEDLFINDQPIREFIKKATP